jgi:hypothetical protein
MHQIHLFNRVMFGCYVITLKVNAKADCDMLQVRGEVVVVTTVNCFLPFRA